MLCILSSRDQHVAALIGCRMEQTDHLAADHPTPAAKTETHPLSTSQRLKRTLQEYEQSILQQQAAAEQELLNEATAAVQTSKQVWRSPRLSWTLSQADPAINHFLPCTQHRRMGHSASYMLLLAHRPLTRRVAGQADHVQDPGCSKPPQATRWSTVPGRGARVARAQAVDSPDSRATRQQRCEHAASRAAADRPAHALSPKHVHHKAQGSQALQPAAVGGGGVLCGRLGGVLQVARQRGRQLAGGAVTAWAAAAVHKVTLLRPR